MDSLATVVGVSRNVLPDYFLYRRYVCRYTESVALKVAWWIPTVVLVVYTIILFFSTNFVPENQRWINFYLLVLGVFTLPKVMLAIVVWIADWMKRKRRWRHHFGMTTEALNGGNINTQGLHHGYIGMSATMWCQDSHSFHIFEGSPELILKVGGITGLSRFSFLPDVLLFCVPECYCILPERGRHRYIPISIPGFGRTDLDGTLDPFQGLPDV